MNAPPTVSSQNPAPAAADKVRWFAPSWMLATFLLFLLPWIEMGCGRRVGNRVEDVEVRLTQSGLQAAYGGITALEDKSPEQRAKTTKGFREISHAAPLMIMYVVFLFIAVVVGFFIRSHRFRLSLLTICSGVCLFVFLSQAVLGFPFFTDVFSNGQPPEANEMGKVTQETLTTPPGPPVVKYEFVVRFTKWFWLAGFFTLLGPAVVFAEWRMRFSVETETLRFAERTEPELT